ncbi:MAG: dienelactone hydrolase family protein [Candidatus Rokubacteria bacterium]|nr:dienelactone hydrolase family protein [Candidatus Rokubacteria bacterium]MBI3107376.1 dienelactone hydrolase family protein [Candidatus Rokubacteria bacterium]
MSGNQERPALSASTSKKRNPVVEFVLYPGAPHAFCSDDRPQTYRKEAAEDAWKRCVAFFTKHLRSEPPAGGAGGAKFFRGPLRADIPEKPGGDFRRPAPTRAPRHRPAGLASSGTWARPPLARMLPPTEPRSHEVRHPGRGGVRGPACQAEDLHRAHPLLRDPHADPHLLALRAHAALPRSRHARA